MGYMTDGLTFRTLRDGNVKRLPLFKTKDGKPGHTKPDGSDWPPASWLQAVIGELGEYANLRKKVERGDYTLAQALPKLASELADVVIYIDLLAFRLGINLGEAVMQTWNAKSEQLKIPMYLDAEDWHYTRQLTDEEKALTNGTYHTKPKCIGCSIEAEIGNEENPHPVPQRFHTCVEDPEPSFIDGSVV